MKKKVKAKIRKPNMGEVIRVDFGIGQDIASERAAQDNDLVAFHELRENGYTERVTPKRIDQLMDYSEQQLLDEIAIEYGLTPKGVVDATLLCAQVVLNEKNKFEAPLQSHLQAIPDLRLK